MPSTEKITYLPLNTSSHGAIPPAVSHERQPRLSRVGKISLLASTLGLLVVVHASFTSLTRQTPHALLAPPLGFPEKIQRRWGQYSPYFPAGGYVQPPVGCEITQVNIVSTCTTMWMLW